MEFKLDPYRRNIPEVTLLKDLVEVCKRLGKESIGEKEYDEGGTQGLQVAQRYNGRLRRGHQAGRSTLR